jgi:hypothetical protein
MGGIREAAPSGNLINVPEELESAMFLFFIPHFSVCYKSFI